MFLVSVETAEPKEAHGVLCALEWRSWVALYVSAVVVHHVIFFNPPKFVLLGRGQVLVLRLIPPLVSKRRSTRGGCIGGNTGIQLVVLVGGDERGTSPIDLHSAPLRSPFVPIPQTRENVHRLLVRIRHPHGLVVRENSDGQVIHQEPASIENKIFWYHKHVE